MTLADPSPVESPTGSVMSPRPMTVTIGAELPGVDLAEVSRSDELFAELSALLNRYKVLFFRDQTMSGAEHVALAERFGPLEDHPVLGSDPEHPGLVRIYRDQNSPKEAYENSYHCDATWRQNPPMGSVLRCVEGPPVGGDTIWVDMAAAYERLPDEVKSRIGGLRARHSIEATFGARLPIDERLALKDRYPDAEHPVVRTHPETGEKVLFVNSFTTHFTNFHTESNIRCGLDYAPGAGDLLQYLQRQATIPDYQVRWRWETNSVAIWDNRATQHYAVQDYWPAVRKMERAGIVGDRPF